MLNMRLKSHAVTVNDLVHDTGLNIYTNNIFSTYGSLFFLNVLSPGFVCLHNRYYLCSSLPDTVFNIQYVHCTHSLTMID